MKQHIAVFTLGLSLLTSCMTDSAYRKVENGLVADIRSGQAKAVKLEVISDDIIRVIASPDGKFSNQVNLIKDTKSLPAPSFQITTSGDTIIVSTQTTQARLSRETGEVRFTDANGHTILREKTNGGKEFTPIEVEGLAMPISVLAAIREANAHHITVKGGKFLEAVAEADTIVFDKTGTLTKAQPTVVDVVSFNGESKENLLRLAACMEEHFPHSMAKAVMDAARERGLTNEEMHSKVEYIVAHGISTTVDGRKAIIGSHHFVFEDEKCTIPEGKEELFQNLPEEYSHLYLGIEGELAAVICIEDPLRPEAPEVIKALRKAGFSQIVMMTGDSDRTAKAIAARVGVDRYYSEVLPEDKARFVEEAKAQGRKVLMVGDGINDSPALSAADVGIAISDGAELAREIADITIGADDLSVMVTLKEISNGLMEKIHKNYRRIVGINGSLIALGVTGVIQPTMSALLHNTSTLLIGMDSMKSVV